MSKAPKLKLADNGLPFQSDKDALEFARANNLRNLQPYAYRGGWALGEPGIKAEDLDPAADERDEDGKASAKSAAKAKDEETFFTVTVHGTDAQGEQQQVLLANGQYYLQVNRGVKVILPGGLIEVLENACYDKHQQIPGYGRKVTVPNVPRFPYTVHGPSTRKDFDAFLRAGNAQRDRDVSQSEAANLAGKTAET